MVKENRIGGILVDVLHWASWADYIEYIGLTPHVVRQCGIIPSYSNSSKINFIQYIFHSSNFRAIITMAI